jgi:hypothetical protein
MNYSLERRVRQPEQLGADRLFRLIVSLGIRMSLRFLTIVTLLPALAAAAVPTPREHLGFTPGDDRKLANFTEIISYFQKIEKVSDRIRLQEFGRSSQGKPMIVAFISAPENLKRLEQFRELNEKLALARVEPDEARRLADTGKAIVWIDSGLHATEVAPSQHAPELAYRMITDESEETRRIRQNVILMQVPCINPDGLDWVVEWYRSNLGTPYELAAMPRLYQKYAGHDNNRDYFMLNLRETRHVTEILFQKWFPHIVYNQHQVPPFPARIFVPPYAEPLNPNIPAGVMEGITLIGAAMKERFARNDQPGVLSYFGFDAWWNGGLRSVPAFHNMHGILTETAGFLYGHSREYKAAEFPERFGNGIPTKEPSVFYERPWMGGKWGVREAIDYMLTADLAILELASSRPAHFLHKAYEIARANIARGEAGKPWAYVIPPDQSDRSAARAMLWRLQYSGVEAHRAAARFEAGGKNYPEGTIVLRTAQPFRGYLVDLMEPQRYPELRTGPGGAVRRPYDIAGWTLPMLMGVAVDRVDSTVNVALEKQPLEVNARESRDHRDTGFFLTMSRLLKEGVKVRWSPDGGLLEPRDAAYAGGKWEFAAPRVAIYEPWTTNMDAGWTDWLLDTFRIPHTMIHNADFKAGHLRKRFDTIILATQSANAILHGIREGERTGARSGPDVQIRQRPEYTGGIGLGGLTELDAFVRDGGTLIAFDAATELPVQNFPLPIRLALRAPEGTGGGDGATFSSPGSILRINVETGHPVAFGMPKEAFAFSTGGQVFDVTLLQDFNQGDREVRVVARYADGKLLASGWVNNERAVLGQPVLVEARHGKGKVLLFGFRPQHRGQTYGTFKLVLNAIFLGSAKSL